MAEKTRISHEETSDPRVDRALAQQQSFGLPVERAEGPRPLLFRPWFALMLAGGIASALAWAVIEPFMDDGLRLRGQIQMIERDPDLAMEGFSEHYVAIGSVWVHFIPGALILDREGDPIDPARFVVGDQVEVLAVFHGVTEDDETFVLADYARVVDGEAPEQLDIAAIAARDSLVSALLFPLSAALIGLFVGAVDGVLSRAWLRATVSGAVSLGIGLIAGFVALLPSEILYGISSDLAFEAQSEGATRLSGGALLIQIMGRGLAWSFVGFAAGIGQGIAMKSRRLFANGAIGGTVGALFGGILFDPIHLGLDGLVRTGGAEISRLVGLVLVGAGVGFMIGVVELVAREAWVKILSGPIAGKEFVLYRDPTWLGSSPKSEIYLFKDPQVSPRHAAIHRVGEHYEIEDQDTETGTFVGGRRVRRHRLRNGDRLQVGATAIEFRLKNE